MNFQWQHPSRTRWTLIVLMGIWFAAGTTGSAQTPRSRITDERVRSAPVAIIEPRLSKNQSRSAAAKRVTTKPSTPQASSHRISVSTSPASPIRTTSRRSLESDHSLEETIRKRRAASSAAENKEKSEARLEMARTLEELKRQLRRTEEELERREQELLVIERTREDKHSHPSDDSSAPRRLTYEIDLTSSTDVMFLLVPDTDNSLEIEADLDDEENMESDFSDLECLDLEDE